MLRTAEIELQDLILFNNFVENLLNMIMKIIKLFKNGFLLPSDFRQSDLSNNVAGHVLLVIPLTAHCDQSRVGDNGLCEVRIFFSMF
jgi:hypothetical protein